MTEQLSGQVVLSSILEGEDTTGTVATFSDANTNDVAGEFTATVNWGDGTTEVGTVTGQNGSFAVAVPGSTHFYADAGTDPITVTVTGPTAGSLAPTNLTYFLAIDGLNGGSTVAGHVGWFEVSSYDVGALVAAMAGSATFSPLTVTLGTTGLTGVLADLANGTVIPSVRLEGVTSTGQVAYDLTLGNVTVIDCENALGGDTLSLSYQQVALTTTAINSKLGNSQTFSWDLTTNSAASAPIPAPVPSGTAGGTPLSSLDYYLAIDGLKGDSTAIGHVGWFEVTSYDVGALVAALAGSATFSPLTVTLFRTPLTDVLGDLANGTVISSVRLEGVTRAGSVNINPQAVYDLTLGHVTVSDYENASGGDTLSLSYQQVALTTRTFTSNGSLGNPQTFSWDLTTNRAAGAPIPPPVPGSVNAITLPSGLTSFLAIDGLNGGSTDAQHVGWFDVSSYDVGALVAAMAGSATFSPLTVTLNATGLTGVLADLARGTVIPSVRLEGVAGGGGTQPPQAVYDLTLGNVTVSDYEDASGGAKLSLSYQQVALTTKAINPNGSLGGSQTFSWDLTTNSAPSAPIPAPVPGTAGSNQITLTGTVVVASAGPSITSVVSSGVVSSGVVVASGDTLEVLSGGTALATVVNSNGSETVDGGGTDSGALISGGEQVVLGYASGAAVYGPGVQLILSGGTASGTILNSAGFQTVSSGGLAIGTTVSSLGAEFVSSGGTDLSAQILGDQDIRSGGTASGSIISSGGQQSVRGLASDVTVFGSGLQTVFAGGTAAGALISGGEQDVAGGLASAATIFSGGSQQVDSDGVASDTIVSSGGRLSVLNGGLADPTTILSGGTEVIFGGTDLGALISGGRQDVGVGYASGAIVFAGGLQAVFAGGTASGTTVSSGGTVELFGGVANGVTIGSGGTAEMSGGQLTISSGGTMAGTANLYVTVGAVSTVLQLDANAIVTGSVEFAGPATLGAPRILDLVSSAGTIVSGFVIDDFVLSDEIELEGVAFDSGGTAIVSGSTLDVFENGTHYFINFGTSISSYHFGLFDSAGAGNTLIEIDQVSVASGATLSGLVIGGGNTSVTVDIASGGIVSGGVIGTSGTLNVSGGTASGVTISSGGTENVVSGGVDSGANITDGGVMIVSSGGTAISGFILDPGSQVVSSGTTASGYVASGGTQFVFGTAISTLVESGVDSGGTFSGLQVVESGGFASATILSGGGVQSVTNSGSANTTTIFAGGLEIIDSGGSAFITDVFGSLNVGGIAISTTVESGGVMNVLSGGLVFSTTILGSGTEIISAGGTDSGAQISGGEQDVFGVASGARVFSGGFEVVSSGGTASATVVSNGGTLELLSGGTATRVVIHPGGSLVLGSGMAGVTGLRIVDVIPFSDSSETADNSEPSVAVDPLNTNEIVAGAFGVFSGGSSVNPYFTSIDGGTTWRPYGALDHNDKTLAWSQDGSTLFTATMLELGGDTSDIKTYSGTISGSDFGSPINTYDPGDNLDQPWIRTGSGGHVYVAYHDFSLTPNSHVLVSSDGGVNYTSAALDRNSGSFVQDAAAVRLAVNGATVYGAFTRWTSLLDFNGPITSDSTEFRYNADLYIVRSDDGGTDGFAALGSGGLGVNIASPTGWYANTSDESLTLGRNRTGAGSELAIAVDPINDDHVVIAYGNAPGASIDAGELGLVVTESFDGGSSWTEKFATP